MRAARTAVFTHSSSGKTVLLRKVYVDECAVRQSLEHRYRPLEVGNRVRSICHNQDRQTPRGSKPQGDLTSAFLAVRF